MDNIFLQDLEGTSNRIAPESQGVQNLNGDGSSHANCGATFTDIPVASSLVEKTGDYFREKFQNHGIQVNGDITVETRLPRRDKYKKKKTKVGHNGLNMTPFHTALVKGDQAFAQKVLEQLSPELCQEVVNALVDYSKPTVFQMAILDEKLQNCPAKLKDVIQSQLRTGRVCRHPLPDVQQGLPLSLAALSGEVSMVKLLLDNKADIFKVDDKGNNCIHNLVLMSKHYTQQAIVMYRYLLKQLHTNEEKQSLVFAKNNQDQQPLDLAFSEACPEFSLALLGTDGVYRFPVRDYGAFQHVLYDVTEYEAPSCSKLHLFSYLSLTREKDLDILQTSNLLEHEPIKTWMKVKGECVQHLMWVWVIYWLIYITLYLTSLQLYYLTDGSQPPLWYSVLLLIFSVISFLSEFFNVVIDRRLYDIMRKKGVPIAFSPAYRMFHWYFSVSLLITESLHLSQVSCEDHHVLFIALYVSNSISALSSLLVFTQLNRHTGHLIIMIDRMIGDVSLFITVAGIIFFSFCFSFYLLHAPPVCHDLNYTLDWNRTSRMFSTFLQSVYETQILSLGLTAPLALYFEDSNAPLLGMLMYVGFLIMMVIVLLNLLIAIMNDRVQELNTYRTTIIQIQSLALTMNLDSKRRLVRLGGGGGSRLRLLARRSAVSQMIENAETGRMYLHVIESTTPSEQTAAEPDSQEVPRRMSTVTLR